MEETAMQEHYWKRFAALSAIVVYFIMALEVMIMISPFAFFFYAVFSPLFNFLGQHAATRWATMFFLPHMILPPTLFLQSVRIAGSIFFLVGFLLFTICALQVYLGKIFKWGIAAKGLYKYIRHPQYLALGIWGIGMAILWPRFIVLATLSLMFILYLFLAKDEERRMLSTYGDSYRRYMDATGRFLPRAIEKPLSSLLSLVIPVNPWKYVVVPALTVALVMGAGFLLREITVHSLPSSSSANFTLVSILPEDGPLGGTIAGTIAQGAESGKIPFLKADRAYLGYVMPPDYIMQGMIADTGGNFHLFKHHHTVALIVDWVIHPFEHLRRPPAAHMAALHQVDPQVARRHHCPAGVDRPEMNCDTCTLKRVVLLEIVPAKAPTSLGTLLASGTARTPVGFVDLDAQSGDIINVKKVEKGTAWKDVPTPEI
jgi:protein-S-isoprenylcysteine O-methyltransferase Ste14